MADTIREFIVSYAFGADTASMARAESATKAAEDRITASNAAALAKRVAQENRAQAERIAAAIKAGTELSQADRRFIAEQEKRRNDAIADERKRAEEASKRNQDQLEQGYKRAEAQALRLTSLAIKTVAAFDLAKLVDRFTVGAFSKLDAASKQFERLNYAAQAMGSSAKGISAVAYAISQLGGNADAAQTSLDNFGSNLQKYKAFEDVLTSMGIQTRDLNGHLKDSSTLFADYLQKLAAMPRAQREAVAGGWGIDEGTVQAGVRPELRARIAEYNADQGAIGADSNATSRSGVAFAQAMRHVNNLIEQIKTSIADVLFRAVTPQLEAVGEWLKSNGKTVSDVIAAIASGVEKLGASLVRAIAGNDSVKDALSILSKGLIDFGNYIGSDDFRKTVKGFVSDVVALARSMRWALEKLGILSTQAGSPVVPNPTGTDDAVGGEGGASLRNRRGTLGHQTVDDEHFAGVRARKGAFDGGRGVGPGADPEIVDFIAKEAAARGIDPRVALQVAANEGLYKYEGDQGTSFGPFQLHYRNNIPGLSNGGMGDDFTRATGKHASDPSTVKDQIRFALDHAAKHGWSNWHGWHGASNAGLGMDPAEAAKLIPSRPNETSGSGSDDVAGDLSGRATYSHGQLDGVKGFIVHHTGGGGSPEGVVQTLNQRGLGVQFVMDRDGKVYRTLPDGARGAHILHSEINDLDNSNTMGMEVIARDDKDVTPAQIKAGKAFLDAMAKKYPGLQVFGHGEVNPHHKMASEGHSIVEAYRAGRAAPATDPNYHAPPIPVEQRNLSTYMGRDPATPAKVEVTDASAFRLGKAFVSSSPLLQVAPPRHANPLADMQGSWLKSLEGMDLKHHPWTHSPAEAQRRMSTSSVRHGDRNFASNPTFHIHTSDVKSGLSAAQMVADRGNRDLIRNMQGMEA